VVAAWLVAATGACGYKVASVNRPKVGFRTVCVVPLENKTTAFEVEQILTRSLVHSLVEKSGYQVVNQPAQADALFSGSVLYLTATPVIFAQETFGSTYLVTLNAKVQLQDRQTGKVIFKNDNYVFREQYQINVDVKNFFTELNPALERIAADFASSVVSTLMEGF
jgi:hypothetical protein